MSRMYSAEIDEQTRIRVRVAMAAYAYEVLSANIMSDNEFDALALRVDLSVKTRRPDLDKFFKKHFASNTGAWVWKHPDRMVLDALIRRHFADRLIDDYSERVKAAALKTKPARATRPAKKKKPGKPQQLKLF